MQNALRELREAKLVVAQQGRAFFVRDPDRAEAVGEDSERLAAIEAGLRQVQEKIAAVEEDNEDLRALIMELYGRQNSPTLARHTEGGYPT